MKRFICVKTNVENHLYILDVFKTLFGNQLESNTINEYIYLFNVSFDVNEIKDIIQALEMDLDSGIKVYLSFGNSESYDLEWDLVKELFDNSGYGIYELRDLIEINKYISNGLDILKYILDGTGVDRNIIEAMALCDLNVSKASNVLYMHRNTLIYKIDKLYEKSGFDIRTFKDLFNLYKMIGA